MFSMLDFSVGYSCGERIPSDCIGPQLEFIFSSIPNLHLGIKLNNDLNELILTIAKSMRKVLIV